MSTLCSCYCRTLLTATGLETQTDPSEKQAVMENMPGGQRGLRWAILSTMHLRERKRHQNKLGQHLHLEDTVDWGASRLWRLGRTIHKHGKWRFETKLPISCRIQDGVVNLFLRTDHNGDLIQDAMNNIKYVPAWPVSQYWLFTSCYAFIPTKDRGNDSCIPDCWSFSNSLCPACSCIAKAVSDFYILFSIVNWSSLIELR